MVESKSWLSEPPEAETRIERHSLHDQILTRLRDIIIEGHLPPGSRINEGQIGAMLGVSRTPLREAIKFLASEGLVELVPARGAIVKKFSAKEVLDILEVLRTLETLPPSAPANWQPMPISRASAPCMMRCSPVTGAAIACPISS